MGERPDRRRDRHVVIVQNDDEALVHRARVVHGLVGHAGAHRAVADHGDHMAALVLALQVARDRHAERGGNRCGGVAGAEWVVLAFGALREAGETAGLPQRADAIPASGENFVRIGLVAHVPDEPVVRRVEKIVDGNRQLDDPQARAEMTARHRNSVDHLVAQLVGDLLKLIRVEFAKVFGGLDGIEEGGTIADSHFNIPFECF